jgi:hypothetical protein
MREFVADYEKMFAEAADAVVDEGVSLARGVGLEASGQRIESAAGAWRAIAEAANEHNAAVIVAGSRGRGRVASVAQSPPDSSTTLNRRRSSSPAHSAGVNWRALRCPRWRLTSLGPRTSRVADRTASRPPDVDGLHRLAIVDRRAATDEPARRVR